MQTDDRAKAVIQEIERSKKRLSQGGFVESDPTLKGIPVEQRRRRFALIESGMKFGMSAQQIEQYTDLMGDRVSRRQVLGYLSDMKQPRNYDSSGRRQHLHDYSVFESFFIIARSLPEVSVCQFNKSPGEGARFRYDFKFRTGNRLFYGEVQLSDLAGTNWRKKMKSYVKWKERSDFPFRVLWVIDQKRDMSMVRYHAKETLKHRPDLNLHYFITLEQLKRGEVEFKTMHGKPASLVD